MHAIFEKVAVENWKKNHACDAAYAHDLFPKKQPDVVGDGMMKAIEEIATAKLKTKTRMLHRDNDVLHKSDQKQIRG
jgi:hypothetical protein